ncbi:hypothetical protein K438DRAFT_1957150 [Mycena galopus ATCC 62051]|nr:hypothetical protein K438DRAFT_1957150 [Mycena galopus ATCC 62051]
MDFTPGLFNNPHDPDGVVGTDFTPLICTSREKEFKGVLACIASAQVTQTGVAFCDSEKKSIFNKRFELLDDAFWELTQDKSLDPRSIIFRSSPRIWNDIGFTATLESEADAESFLVKLREASPPNSRKYTFPTKTYILDGQLAKLLPLNNTLSAIITDTLTALACTDIAAVLGPVLDWSVAHTPIQTSRLVADVQNWLRTSLPPLVVVGESTDGSNLFPQITYQDDIEGQLDVIDVLNLPQRPVWPLTHVDISPSDSMWLLPAVSNYGIHRREREATTVPVIFISTELVGWLLAAIRATAHKSSADAAAIRSLRAATASIQVTLVHELAHVWVTQKHQGDSPLRQSVIGADVPKYDAAEDEQSAGLIEAGNLVETAWFGGPHRLALDNDGWLRFVVTEAQTSTTPSTSAVGSSSDTSSESGSFLNRLVRSHSNSDDTESDFSTDSEEHPSSSPSPSSSSSLGSPIQLQQSYGNPIFHDLEIAAVEEQDRIQYVRVCTDEALKGLWVPGPRLSNGIGDLGPLIRAKGYRHLHAPKPTPRPVSPSTQRPGNLFIGKKVPLYPMTAGMRPRWPSVLGRQVPPAPPEVDAPGAGDQRSNADCVQRCITSKTPRTKDK